jgi:light-regulated signal transduction histidine kinase (bacteriophytochrome)
MIQKDPKICIIEDSPQEREVFRRYLLQDTDYRYAFFEEESGERGLVLCRTVQPDCILLDSTLPDIDGLEFLSELADESGLVTLPVIMLTSVGDEAVALEAMKRGAQDYLVKDEMTPGNLFRAIHNAIERSAMRRIVEQQRHDLERKNQEIEAFAYALAHDLRAPIRAISSFGQIVAQEYHEALDDEGRRYVDIIVRSSLQMDRLINELLSYTRIEHRSIRLRSVALDVLLSQVVNNLGERIAALQAIITIAAGLPSVEGDATLLTQIFTNLIDNALTYRRADVPVRIEVAWHKEVDNAIIYITDNGIGIAAKHYDKIFNIFQRLHSDEEYPGTGIGLAIVKKATELMGGQIWIESVVGERTCFYVKLPLHT